MWFDYVLQSLFGIKERLNAANADPDYDQIAGCLAQDGLPTPPSFERFNIEVIATTEGSLDDLRWHAKIRDSGWRAASSPPTG